MANGNGQTENDSRVHLAVPPGAFVLFLGFAFAGGAGGMSAIREPLDQAAISQCFDNSATAIRMAENALGVAAQHGEEFNEIRFDLRGIKDGNYTDADAKRDHGRYDERIELLKERLDLIESRVRN